MSCLNVKRLSRKNFLWREIWENCIVHAEAKVSLWRAPKSAKTHKLALRSCVHVWHKTETHATPLIILTMFSTVFFTLLEVERIKKCSDTRGLNFGLFSRCAVSVSGILGKHHDPCLMAFRESSNNGYIHFCFLQLILSAVKSNIYTSLWRYRVSEWEWEPLRAICT